MKELKVTCFCQAVYRSSIMVPDNLSKEEAVKYAEEHIDEINVGELEWVSDSDQLDAECCEFAK